MVVLLALLVSFLQAPDGQPKKDDLIISAMQCDSIPAFNKHIIEFVTSTIGQKVGRGECWDLAAAALNNNHAKWDGRYGYGKKLDPNQTCVYPGDIVQFEQVVMEVRKGTSMFREEMPHHTAIIYEVNGPGHYVIAQQNYGNVRKVILTDFELKNIKRGQVLMYRPVK